MELKIFYANNKTKRLTKNYYLNIILNFIFALGAGKHLGFD